MILSTSQPVYQSNSFVKNPYPQQTLPYQYVYQTVPIESIEYKNVPVENIEYRQVPITEVSYQRVPIQAPITMSYSPQPIIIEHQPQATPLKESKNNEIKIGGSINEKSQAGIMKIGESTKHEIIKGDSVIEYVPFQRSYYENVPVEKVDYVPVERKDIDYYAIERQREYVPVSKLEAVQEMVPQERIEYVPQTRIEYVPQYRTEMVPVQRLEEKVDYEPLERSIIHYPTFEREFYEEAEQSGRIRSDYAGYFNDPLFGVSRQVLGEPLMERPPPINYEETSSPFFRNHPPEYMRNNFSEFNNQRSAMDPNDIQYFQNPRDPRFIENYYEGPTQFRQKSDYERPNYEVSSYERPNDDGFADGRNFGAQDANFRQRNLGFQYEPFYDKNIMRSANNIELLENRLNNNHPGMNQNKI